MSARLATLARRWDVSLLTIQESCHASGTHFWRASACAMDLPRDRPDAFTGVVAAQAPTREAALFLLKAAIDDARKLVELAA